MPFTVAHRGGTKDFDFSTYGRFLGYQGVDLAHAPRTLDPDTGRRWLYVWDTREKAEAFARKLKKKTGDKEWHVRPVEGAVCEGPLGPIEITIGLRTDGLAFDLETGSRAMLRTLFPDAEGIEGIRLYTEVKRTRLLFQRLDEVVRHMLPVLTGLKLEQLDRLGYRVWDPEHDKELLLAPPGDTCPAADRLLAGLSSGERQASDRC